MRQLAILALTATLGCATAARAVNHPPTVRARCEPCSVPAGKTSTLSAQAQDTDRDRLTYRWSAPAGTLEKQNEPSTTWTAPGQQGPVPVVVTVSDGRGGTASDVVTIQVLPISTAR